MIGLLLSSALLGLLCSASALVLLRMEKTQKRLTARLATARHAAGLASEGAGIDSSAPLQWVSALGNAVARSGVLSDKTVHELEAALAIAGFRGQSGLGLFVGSKLLLFAGLPVMMWFGLAAFGVLGIPHLGLTVAAAVAGLLGPDYVVKSLRAAYLKQLDRGLPDALDMMVICSEAGLSLEPTIARVAAEISHTHPAVGNELQQTATELRMVADRKTALHNMGSRTGLDALKRLGTTLVQTMQYGTPLSQALRNLSAEMRAEMLTRFEERAARLPVLLTVPMIVFILPTVFAVVGGPAMLNVIASLHQ